MKHPALSILLSAAIALAAAPVPAAQEKVSGDVVRIGVLTDLSGIYSQIGGQGSVVAAQMAVEDFGGKVLGKPIEIVSADHQNRVDIGAKTAIEWYERDGVDMITDVLNSAVAIVVSQVAAKRRRIVMVTGAATTQLTNESCTPYTVHHTYDTYSLAHGTGGALVKEGGNVWAFLTADYPFGHSLERETAAVVRASGGKVLGAARHPFNTKKLDPYLLRLEASDAKIIGLANAGGDTVKAIKAASALGVTKHQSIAALLLFISDIHDLGLPTAQGMFVTSAWYWNLNDQTRAFARRFYARTKRMPTMVQAGTYSSVTMYLKGVRATGTDDADAVMTWMKSTLHTDVFGKNMRVRADGRLVHDMYLMQVKKPAESKSEWDYYDMRRTIPGAEAFQPLSASRCPMVNRK
ncbi:MAG: ABC transporter substrate-binding protein [Betaproteobacteria bacterium]|jgi:branched-chain amino acid transport system substrate-binding protein|nr:ABC transporter substrate-binding protein [Betaproteobacteria bacterium]